MCLRLVLGLSPLLFIVLHLCSLNDRCLIYVARMLDACTLAKAHIEWLEASEHPTCPRAPLFPTTVGEHPSELALGATFEAIGALCGQPRIDAEGHNLFAGHSHAVRARRPSPLTALRSGKARTLASHPLALRRPDLSVHRTAPWHAAVRFLIASSSG